MPASSVMRTTMCAASMLMLLLVACSFAYSDSVVFSDNFDDGNWTENPIWTASPSDPSISISSERSVSAPYSFKVAAVNNSGAVRTPSGLTHISQTFTCTFQLYVESVAEEGIPLCLQDAQNGIVLIVFLLPNNRVEFTHVKNGVWTNTFVNGLTYGVWHTFKVTYDGTKSCLFIDNHTEPDATINQSITVVPWQLVIGNFQMAHTGTFYVDDVTITASEPPPPPPPGKVYVQFCSDTSTGGLNLSKHYNTFPTDDYSYTSPTGQAAQVMAESWRNAHVDSLGNKIKLTWYMNCGSLYTCGLTSGPLLPYDLMIDNHGEEIARWGDEMAYHYHTWFWDGSAWSQTAEFTPCQPDFELVVAHFILERNFYPCSFRSGWNWMSNLWENYLDDWFPYRFEGSSPLGNWIPYHPSSTNWKAAGDQRGWESLHAYTVSQTATSVNAAFAAAYNQGIDQVVTFWSHLKETDFATKIDEIAGYFTAAHAKYPTIEFEYVTGHDAMLKWRRGTDVTPPVISVSTSDAAGIRTAIISINEDIYQKQPFVALAKMDGTYSRLDCTAHGGNQWGVSYSLADTVKIGVGVTDWFGNATVKQLPAAFLLMNAKATAATTSIVVDWETSQPADTKVDYRPIPSGSAAAYHDPALTTKHHVTLDGLQPATVYKLDISATNEGGEHASAKSIYVLTGLSDPVVVDNSDAGFSVTGTWSTGTSAAGHYGPDYRYISTSPSGTPTASWTWQAPTAALWRISLWWSGGSNRSTATPYTVIIGGTEYPKVVNQQIDGGKWNEHGVYYLAAGETVTIRLSNAAPSGSVVIADAVKFERAYIPLQSISLGRLVGDGPFIAFPSATVTAVFDGEFYIQDSSRLPGIRVIGSGVTEGSLVEVSGALSTINGERVISNPTIR